MPKRSEPFRCIERVRLSPDSEVHPGWVRATAILLRGMERLRAQSLALPDETDNHRSL